MKNKLMGYTDTNQNLFPPIPQYQPPKAGKKKDSQNIIYDLQQDHPDKGTTVCTIV